MTAADKLRELLATRPAMPNTEELVRWWRTGAELMREHFNDLKATATAVVELSAECSRRGKELDVMRMQREELRAARDEACQLLENIHLVASRMTDEAYVHLEPEAATRVGELRRAGA